MLSENEALKEYCKQFHYDALFTDDELKGVYEAEKLSLGFQKYLLYLAVEELKQSIFDELPVWLQRFLRR